MGAGAISRSHIGYGPLMPGSGQNSVDPGWVQTSMGGSGASRTVQKGAETAIWLATLPDNGPTGGFFRDRKTITW